MPQDPIRINKQTEYNGRIQNQHPEISSVSMWQKQTTGKRNPTYNSYRNTVKYLWINFNKGGKNSTMKTMWYWWKRLKGTQANEKASCGQGMDE